MKRKDAGPWLVLTAALTALGAWKVPAQGRSAGEAAAQAEVRSAWDEYIRAFSAGRADLIADGVYLAPSFNLAEAGIQVSMSPADTRARFKAAMEMLAAQSYLRTETKSARICLLNDTAAVLSGQFTRYRKDGSVLAEAAGTYVFAKLPQGWRIVASIPHSPERVLKCGV